MVKFASTCLLAFHALQRKRHCRCAKGLAPSLGKVSLMRRLGLLLLGSWLPARCDWLRSTLEEWVVRMDLHNTARTKVRRMRVLLTPDAPWAGVGFTAWPPLAVHGWEFTVHKFGNRPLPPLSFRLVERRVEDVVRFEFSFALHPHRL